MSEVGQHGRTPEKPTTARRWLRPLALTCLLLCSLSASRASAQPATRIESNNLRTGVIEAVQVDLSRWSKMLASESAGDREAAAKALSSLPAKQLRAIEARIQTLAAHRADRDDVLAAMTRFRTVQGGDSPNDLKLDMAAGILPTLAERRDPARVQAAESLLLLRSLEKIGGVDAANVAVSIFALDAGPWKWEARRSTLRFGADMLPVVVTHRQGHPRRQVRSWCNWSLERLGMPEPGQAVTGAPRERLIALMLAWGKTHNHDALPVLVSYLGDSRRSVRAAAHTSLGRFGSRARWSLRDGYLSSSGKPAPSQWGAKRLLAAIATLHAAPRRERFQAEVTHARAQMTAERPVRALDALDEITPSDADDAGRFALAQLYADCGEALFSQGNLRRAYQAFGRALRYKGERTSPPQWLSRRLLLEAELRMDQRWADLRGFEQALEVDPESEAAATAVHHISGKHAAKAKQRKQLAGWGGAGVLLALGLWMLCTVRSRRSVEESPADPVEGEAEAC